MELIKAFLPLLIFLSVWFGIGIYYGHKVKRHRQKVVEDVSTPANCLSLVRGVDQTNYLRKYKVILDGEVVGDIASGETRHFPISPGKHVVSVKIDWCKSNPHEFLLPEGGNTKLLCGATYNNWKCLLMWAIKPSSYVYVSTASNKPRSNQAI